MTGPAPRPPASRLELPFRRAGRDSVVTVEVGVNDDPAALGCPDFARGFPVCRATIVPPARGYNDALGWIQMVASNAEHATSTGSGEFAMDSFEPLGETPVPFCFFGFAPVLFDAPHRDSWPDMDRVAHSFLAELTGPREVGAILGFSWGFAIRDGRISLADPTALAADGSWDRYLPLLAAEHPGWTFAPGLVPDGEGRGAI